MPGAARDFNGTSDRLNTGQYIILGATASFSCYAWIKRVVGTLGSVLGVVHSFVPNNRLEFQTSLTNVGTVPKLQLYMRCSGVPSFRTVDTVVGPTGNVGGNPFWYNKPIFVAFVNDVPNTRARFFWGLTVSSIIEVDVADFTTSTADTAVTQQWTDPAVTLNVGATGREGQSNAIPPLAQDFFSGVLDSVGLELNTVLTLAQVKERAQCGLNNQPYYWPIIGSDPETGITAIIGTTVVDGICGVTALTPVKTRKTLSFHGTGIGKIQPVGAF